MEQEEFQENDETVEFFSSSGNLMDSKMSHLDDLLNEKLENVFHKQTSQIILHDLAKIALEHDPIDLAYAVVRLPVSARYILYENLPDNNARMIFLINTGSSTRSAILRCLSDKEVKQIVESMPPNEAVWVLESLSDRRLRRLLDMMESGKAARIRELQKHDRHSAGRLMTNEFFAFPMNTTIGQVAMHIRDNPGIELTRRIFVHNDEQELIGYVPARNLIVNPPHIPIRQVMRPIVHKVSPEATRDEVIDIVERYKIPALPIVNELEHLLGIITYEDVVEMMEDIADETIASIAGTAEDVSEHEPIWKRFFWRAPWLVVTLCAGLVSSTGLAYFHDQPWFSIVPFFVPLITGMSGNVGIQCSTILVRGMATGEISSGTKGEAVLKELGIGLLIGLIFGLLCGFVIYLLNVFHVHNVGVAPIVVGSMVSAGVFVACLTATALGTFSPLFFAKFRVDPAVASGPIVTAFNDVLSTFMYFIVAKAVISFFQVMQF